MKQESEEGDTQSIAQVFAFCRGRNQNQTYQGHPETKEKQVAHRPNRRRSKIKKTDTEQAKLKIQRHKENGKKMDEKNQRRVKGTKNDKNGTEPRGGERLEAKQGLMHTDTKRCPGDSMLGTWGRKKGVHHGEDGHAQASVGWRDGLPLTSPPPPSAPSLPLPSSKSSRVYGTQQHDFGASFNSMSGVRCLFFGIQLFRPFDKFRPFTVRASHPRPPAYMARAIPGICFCTCWAGSCHIRSHPCGIMSGWDQETQSGACKVLPHLYTEYSQTLFICCVHRELYCLEV